MDAFSTVIPTLNEAKNIGQVIEDLQEIGDVEVIVVDDGSTDGTREEARRHGADVIQRSGKRSLSLSVLEGLEKASREKVVVMDGDGQHPTGKIPEILEGLDSHDLIVVSRRAVEGRWQLHRRLMSLGAESLAKIFFSNCREVKDPISGFFGVRKSELDLEAMEPRGYKVLMEVLAVEELDVGETDFVFRQRDHGSSCTGPKSVMDFLLHVLHLKYRQVKKRESQ